MKSEYNMNKETAKTNTFLLRYTPAKRHGVDNWKNEEFTYYISVSGNIFNNREEKNPVGFYGFEKELASRANDKRLCKWLNERNAGEEKTPWT